jgi:predicted GNAT superfamily acetyltransferase
MNPDQTIEWEYEGKHFSIRPVSQDHEYHEIEEIQREAWSFSDLDIVPAATLVATQHVGGLVIGAFENKEMAGFAYAFPAFEDGRASLHSHMLAVRPDYRNYEVGSRLKLAQRSFALDQGYDEITWTFDPLQSLNAHLNFRKLGVISKRYVVDFYGEATSSPLHQGFGTDRLWVNWYLNSDRVKDRIEGQLDRQGDLSGAPYLIKSEADRPVRHSLIASGVARTCLIEIPRNINTIKEAAPDLAASWRRETRAAFLEALGSGFTIQDFVSSAHTNSNAYLLVW